MLSCFMVIRNGIDLGYPFIEAISTALPLCDEFLVSDGNSSDGTYEALVKYFSGTNKVKIFRDQWDNSSIKGSAIRNALNKVRNRCTGDYILEVDANEIIPPEDYEFIKSLPLIYPDKEIFGFPYYQIMGSEILFTEEFRLRFAKNKKSIKVMWDGYTLGHHLDLRTMFEKGTIRRILNRFLTSILEERVSGGFAPEQYIYLPTPIFRYYSIFPENFFKKMSSKLFFQPDKDYTKMVSKESDKELKSIWSEYLETNNYSKFWEEVYNFHVRKLKEGIILNKEFIENRRIPSTSQPQAIRGLFGKRRYELPSEIVNFN